MVYSLKGLSTMAHAARAAGHDDQPLNAFVHSALFSTLTNVNFDDSRMVEFIEGSVRMQARLIKDLKVSAHVHCWAPRCEAVWYLQGL